MGYDLRSAHGTQHWGIDTWRELLELAERYGWQPEGTQPPESFPNPEWAGGYFSNDHQRVTEHDAAALAVALDAVWEAGDFVLAMKGLLEDMPVYFISKGGARFSYKPSDVRELADYCRQGAFSIA